MQMLIIEYDVMMIKQNVTHVRDLYHVTNADVGGTEYADVSLHGESGMLSWVVMLTQQCGQRAKVTHGLYHMTNADVGGLECADVSLHGESRGYADS